jgi:hypothetical protein
LQLRCASPQISLFGGGYWKKEVLHVVLTSRISKFPQHELITFSSGDKVVFGVTPTIFSFIGSGLILGGALWVAAAKDTDKPNPAPQKEWAKDDLALSGGEGAEGLLNAEGSTQKRGEVWSEEREALMISHNDDDENDHRDPDSVEVIELRELDLVKDDLKNQDRNEDNREQEDLL